MIYQMVTLDPPNHPNFCIFGRRSYVCSGST